MKKKNNYIYVFGQGSKSNQRHAKQRHVQIKDIIPC